MGSRALVVWLTGLLAATVVVVAGPAGAAAAAGTGDPAFTVPAAQLAAAVDCDANVSPASGRTTVLLVHGTGSTPAEAWGWNYARSLPAAGYAVCTVALPGRANGDFTVSAEYVAYAAKVAIARSGRDIAIMGHSQGGLIAAWVATYWPGVAAHTSDVIGLAAPWDGTAVATTLCVGGACSPLAWQLARGSHAIAALQTASRSDHPAYTSIAAATDELVNPQPSASSLPGVRPILVQQICPVQAVEHGTILADATAYALVIDALGHSGPAEPARISRAVCLQPTAPDVDLVGAAPFYKTVVSLGVGLFDVAGWVRSEPPLPSYAADPA